MTRPVVELLSRSTNLVVRIAGAGPDQQRAEVTEEELRELVAAQETFTSGQRQVIDGAFGISKRSVGEVLRPRGDVFAEFDDR